MAASSVYGYVIGNNHHSASMKSPVKRLTRGPKITVYISSAAVIPPVSPLITAPYGISVIFFNL